MRLLKVYFLTVLVSGFSYIAYANNTERAWKTGGLSPKEKVAQSLAMTGTSPNKSKPQDSLLSCLRGIGKAAKGPIFFTDPDVGFVYTEVGSDRNLLRISADGIFSYPLSNRMGQNDGSIENLSSFPTKNSNYFFEITHSLAGPKFLKTGLENKSSTMKPPIVTGATDYNYRSIKQVVTKTFNGSFKVICGKLKKDQEAYKNCTTTADTSVGAGQKELINYIKDELEKNKCIPTEGVSAGPSGTEKSTAK